MLFKSIKTTHRKIREIITLNTTSQLKNLFKKVSIIFIHIPDSRSLDDDPSKLLAGRKSRDQRSVEVSHSDPRSVRTFKVIQGLNYYDRAF